MKQGNYCIDDVFWVCICDREREIKLTNRMVDSGNIELSFKCVQIYKINGK